jgi:hypothetical protein
LSKSGKIVHEVAVIAEKNFEGSFAHQARLRQIFAQFVSLLKRLDLLPGRVKEIQLWTIKLYAHYLLARGVSDATVHNRVSALRVLMDRAGRNVSAVTNSEIGLTRRDRSGKKVPHTREELDTLFARAIEIDEGFLYVLQLEVFLGLRGLEAIRSSRDIPRWLQQVLNGATYVEAKHGCKGGRHRNIAILPGWRQETISMLRQAEKYSLERGGRLITARRDDLEGSLNRLRKLYQRAGLRGEKSAQALRYFYACQNAIERIGAGQDELHVLGEVAEDLGHGAKTRKRFTLTTYLKSVSYLFEDVIENDRLVSKHPQNRPSNSTADTLREWLVPRGERALKSSKRRRRRTTSLVTPQARK